VLIQTKTESILPPDVLLIEPAKPEIKYVVTTRDIVENSDAFERAYLLAVDQIRVLREWVKSQKVTK
jgi:hypothetical protein